MIGIGLAALLFFGVAVVAAGDIQAPDKPGSFNVGVTTFSATMSAGRVTRIQVYYPTLAAADENARYTIQTPAGPYQLRSPLGAVAEARPAPGSFPLVVHGHGGAAFGADFQRVAQLPLHETMASHGIVTVVALHSAVPSARSRDMSLVIDVMLARSAYSGDLLFDSIDPEKIGISGQSAGGTAAVGAVADSIVDGTVADSRIKAMVHYEPGGPPRGDASTITIPYLIMGGDQHRSGLAVRAMFEATTLATPRIYVLNPNATHFNYLTGMGEEIDQTREAALLANPTMPEPLTTRVATNAAAIRAYDLWNQGEILFPLLGYGAGGGRNYCTRVGVNSVRPLDVAPRDSFTDSPPLLPTDAFTLKPAVPEEIMVPLIKLYTVAFWKTHLEGDHRYMRYLTPGYAKRNELEAIVEIE
jgi:predicted dienelactone hydrolase